MKPDFLTTALRAANESADIIKKYFSPQGITTDRKADNSPVTIADKEAEQCIRSIIAETYPEHGFIGEEFGVTKNISSYTWIIDPIDGTRNFSRGVPHFGTLIALMHNDEIVLGVSHLPMQNETLYATAGEGAFNQQGDKVHVSNVATIEDSYITFGGLKHVLNEKNAQATKQIALLSSGTRAFCDSWMYHFIAQGTMEAAIEGKVSIWDIAALKIIIEEAGGTMTDMNGQKVTLDTTSVITSNGQIHQELLNFYTN